jgi:hypothetical protein
MIAANKVWLAFVVFVVLALISQDSVHATDETSFREEAAQTTSLYHGDAEYVHQIVVSTRSDEQKVQALKRVFHLGMSSQEVDDILGMPRTVVLTGSTIWAVYGFDLPAFTILYCGSEGAVSVVLRTKTGHDLTIVSKWPN